ncbi:MAG: sulfur carrier protein ThiS [Gemmatimonadetes bacterium]|nr:sulfur carrier protein ThiS [Gemmatimonadota bacterium]
MRVRLNGEERALPAGLTVTALLESLGLNAALVVVELNREILGRGAYGRVELRDGDAIELVHFVGGG